MAVPSSIVNAETRRLEEDRLGKQPWRKWGPFLSERQWGTVREDYSADGDAWNYFPHELARSKAYRWGDDGIAGICDRTGLVLGIMPHPERHVSRLQHPGWARALHVESPGPGLQFFQNAVKHVENAVSRGL